MTSALSATQAPTPLKRERRKLARPGELLNAVLELFVEKGFSATRVEEVAARAGVSKGTLFLYFPSKVDLFKAVVRENIAIQFPTWQEELKTFQGSSAELLRYALFSWWERIGQTPASGICKLVLSEAQNFPEIAAFYQDEVIQPGHALMHSILAQGVRRGEFHVPDLEQMVHLVVAPMIFLMMWKHSIGACATSSKMLDPEQFIQMQVNVLLNGIATKKSV